MISLVFLGMVLSALTLEAVGKARQAEHPWTGWAIAMVGHVLRTVANVGWTIDSAVHADYVWAAIFTITSAISARAAWQHWKNRPPRQRKSLRAWGLVVDLGHRLTVAPAPA